MGDCETLLESQMFNLNIEEIPVIYGGGWFGTGFAIAPGWKDLTNHTLPIPNTSRISWGVLSNKMKEMSKVWKTSSINLYIVSEDREKFMIIGGFCGH